MPHLVTAESRLLQVNEQTHPDLLWGLRGGGGNFGIVTSLECALYPVKDVFGGQVVYPIAQGKGVFNTYLEFLDVGEVGPYLTRAAYTPKNYQRLRALKERYDAKNVFRFNHNIPPSSR